MVLKEEREVKEGVLREGMGEHLLQAGYPLPH